MTSGISVIIPTRRGVDTLVKCVDSVLADAVPETEVILVDNGSDDETQKVLSTLESRVSAVVRVGENLGYAGGNNVGSRVAKGGILFFLNDDAWILPGTLESVRDRMLRDESIGVIGAKVYDPDGVTLQQTELVLNEHGVSRFVGIGEKDNGQYDKEREVACVAGTAWAIRRELWERVGGFAEAYFPGYYEDAEFCWMCHRLGFKVIYMPSVRACHRGMSTLGRLSRKYFFYYHRHRLLYALRTGERSFLRRFVWGEIGWVLSFRYANQIPSLFRAYLWNLFRIRRTLCERKVVWQKLL